jgi:hypothetical protein
VRVQQHVVLPQGGMAVDRRAAGGHVWLPLAVRLAPSL